MRKTAFFLGVFFIAVALFGEEAVPTGRLPRDVQPTLYDISLTIIPEQKTFSGKVSIYLNLQHETNRIWLNGKDLKVQSSTIILPDKSEISAKYSMVDESGVVRIDASKNIPAGTAILTIIYEAPFNEKLEGLYRVEEDGRPYAFTQFEAISARLCFPGFDEPSFKTPFDVTLTVKKDHVAIANMLPIEEKDASNGMKQLRFARTEKIPTYLVAFAVGPFDVVAGPDIPPNEFRKEPVPLRGIATQGKGKQFQYSLQNTGKILQAFERFFAFGYAFHKLDILAVPDFEWGAMENPGAITFRDGILLMDEKDAPAIQKRYFATVMAHELAHQWLGNVVTMEWWDDIWLNEGLTSWSESQVTKELYPEFQSELADIESKFRVMEFDSTSATHPIRQPVKNATEIRSIGDGITFTKGSSVTQMFNNFIGEDEFKSIIRKHVQKHRFANANTDEFIGTVKEIAGDDVGESFRSFVIQEGVPFIDFTSSCEGTKYTIKPSESRYIPLGASISAKEKWRVPVCLRLGRSGNESEHCEMTEPNSALILREGQCPDWIMPNADASGYYRWNLSPEGWRNLRERGLSKLNAAEQLAVIDSIKASFNMGNISATEALNSIASFVTSDIHEIATAPVPLYRFFRNYLLDSTAVLVLEKQGREWYRPVYERLKFDPSPDEPEKQKEFRQDVIDFLAFEAPDPEIRKVAMERGIKFSGFGADNKIHEDAVDANVRETALGVAAQEEPVTYLKLLIDHLKVSQDPLLRYQILNAIGHVNEPEKREIVLQLSLDPSLRTNEVSAPLYQLMSEKENWEDVWKFLTTNYDALLQRMPSNTASELVRIGQYFCTDEKATEVKNFFEKRIQTLPGGTRNLTATLESIRICAARVKHHRKNPPQL
jgi:alanyl aminopeptidase